MGAGADERWGTLTACQQSWADSLSLYAIAISARPGQARPAERSAIGTCRDAWEYGA